MEAEAPRVRILNLDGKISDQRYIMVDQKPDKKGLLVVVDAVTGNQIKINHKRVLTDCSDEHAVVLPSGDKYRAICTKCTFVTDVVVGNEWLECPDHGLIRLRWKERKHKMNESAVDTVAKGGIAKPKNDVKTADGGDSHNADPKSVAPTLIDFAKLSQTPHVEVWTKKNIQFDHAKMDVRAHVLLFVGENPRKMCFNSYDGSAGKKNVLPFDDFVAGAKTDKKSWYDVKDVQKTRDKLLNSGYEKMD
jgi:hypothetical protein